MWISLEIRVLCMILCFISDFLGFTCLTFVFSFCRLMLTILMKSFCFHALVVFGSTTEDMDMSFEDDDCQLILYGLPNFDRIEAEVNDLMDDGARSPCVDMTVFSAKFDHVDKVEKDGQEIDCFKAQEHIAKFHLKRDFFTSDEEKNARSACQRIGAKRAYLIELVNFLQGSRVDLPVLSSKALLEGFSAFSSGIGDNLHMLLDTRNAISNVLQGYTLKISSSEKFYSESYVQVFGLPEDLGKVDPAIFIETLRKLALTADIDGVPSITGRPVPDMPSAKGWVARAADPITLGAVGNIGSLAQKGGAMVLNVATAVGNKIGVNTDFGQRIDEYWNGALLVQISSIHDHVQVDCSRNGKIYGSYSYIGRYSGNEKFQDSTTDVLGLEFVANCRSVENMFSQVVRSIADVMVPKYERPGAFNVAETRVVNLGRIEISRIMDSFPMGRPKNLELTPSKKGSMVVVSPGTCEMRFYGLDHSKRLMNLMIAPGDFLCPTVHTVPVAIPGRISATVNFSSHSEIYMIECAENGQKFAEYKSDSDGVFHFTAAAAPAPADVRNYPWELLTSRQFPSTIHISLADLTASFVHAGVGVDDPSRKTVGYIAGLVCANLRQHLTIMTEKLDETRPMDLTRIRTIHWPPPEINSQISGISTNTLFWRRVRMVGGNEESDCKRFQFVNGGSDRTFFSVVNHNIATTRATFTRHCNWAGAREEFTTYLSITAKNHDDKVLSIVNSWTDDQLNAFRAFQKRIHPNDALGAGWLDNESNIKCSSQAALPPTLQWTCKLNKYSVLYADMSQPGLTADQVAKIVHFKISRFLFDVLEYNEIYVTRQRRSVYAQPEKVLDTFSGLGASNPIPKLLYTPPRTVDEARKVAPNSVSYLEGLDARKIVIGTSETILICLHKSGKLNIHRFRPYVASVDDFHIIYSLSKAEKIFNHNERAVAECLTMIENQLSFAPVQPSVSTNPKPSLKTIIEGAVSTFTVPKIKLPNWPYMLRMGAPKQKAFPSIRVQLTESLRDNKNFAQVSAVRGTCIDTFPLPLPANVPLNRAWLTADAAIKDFVPCQVWADLEDVLGAEKKLFDLKSSQIAGMELTCVFSDDGKEFTVSRTAPSVSKEDCWAILYARNELEKSLNPVEKVPRSVWRYADTLKLKEAANIYVTGETSITGVRVFNSNNCGFSVEGNGFIAQAEELAGKLLLNPKCEIRSTGPSVPLVSLPELTCGMYEKILRCEFVDKILTMTAANLPACPAPIKELRQLCWAMHAYHLHQTIN